MVIQPVAPEIDLGFVGPDYLDDCLRFMLYGETGTGKTWLAAEADDVEGMAPVSSWIWTEGPKPLRTVQS